MITEVRPTTAALRRIVPLLVAAVLLASCGSDGDDAPAGGGQAAPTPVKFSFEWTCEGDWALAYIAEAQGYFTQENIKVEHVRGQGGSAVLPLVASGEQDIGEVSAPAVVLGAGQELPVTVVGVASTTSPVVLFADGAISKPEDLIGKKVAVQNGEFEGAVWKAFVKATGLDESKIEEVPAAGTSNTLFIDKKVDAFISFYLDPATVALTNDREGEESLLFMKDHVPTYGHTIVANNRFLQEKPDAVRGFLKAWARAMQYATAHRDETLELLKQKCPELSAEPAAFTLDAFLTDWNTDQSKQNGYLAFDPAGLQQTQKVLVDAGMTEATDLSKLSSTEYLPNPPIKP
jgi:NitT/TauT family transport system substrate-binding protein